MGGQKWPEPSPYSAMSTQEPTRRERAPLPGEATQLFSQWQIYRVIVDADWMGHRGIFKAIRTWVLVRYPGPFTLLDLGCGDAGWIKATFDETGLWSYSGVDASQAALAVASDELAATRFKTRLVEADLLAYLHDIHEGVDSAARTFDVILASYAVHHLPTPKKSEFFRLAHGRLAPGGTLLYADIFRNEGESRDDCLDRYVGMMRQAWTSMPRAALASIIEHVARCDFPETASDIFEMARAAGFHPTPHELFRDATGFHRLFAVTKGTDLRSDDSRDVVAVTPATSSPSEHEARPR